MEAEKQVKFFQNCVAAAFAERDQSVIEVVQCVIHFLMLLFCILVIFYFVVAITFTTNFQRFLRNAFLIKQAEKAKEKQDIMTQKVNDLEKR